MTDNLFFCKECGSMLENKEIFDDEETKDGLYLVCIQCNEKYSTTMNDNNYILIGTIINKKKDKSRNY